MPNGDGSRNCGLTLANSSSVPGVRPLTHRKVLCRNWPELLHIPSKIRCLDRSTVTSYPASINALQVVGVTINCLQ